MNDPPRMTTTARSIEPPGQDDPASLSDDWDYGIGLSEITDELSGPYPLSVLEPFVGDLFAALGVPAGDVPLAVEAMLVADLRGIDSHGVARFTYYASRVRRGLVNMDAGLQTVRETASTLVLDANNGFGLTLPVRAMLHCIEKAAETGICFTTVRHSNHFGIAGHYVELATRQRMGAMAMTNSSPLVAPMFGRVPRLGTNPIAIGVPTGRDYPLILDMATSAIPWGKLENARRSGAPLTPGIAFDRTGETTTDPYEAQFLAPLGGARESGGHKGYGLAMMVDVLCGPLSGGAWSMLVSGAAGGSTAAGTSHSFMAWRIDAFLEPDAFETNVQAMIDELRQTPTTEQGAATGVLVPGDPEFRTEAIRRVEGIPIHPSVVNDLRELATSLGIESPL